MSYRKSINPQIITHATVTLISSDQCRIIVNMTKRLPSLFATAGTTLPEHMDEQWLDKMQSCNLLLHGRQGEYQPGLLTRLLLRHNGFECIPLRSNSHEAVAGDEWSVEYGIKEIPGEIESAIILWWQLPNALFDSVAGTQRGRYNVAMSVAALSVEKSLKTLLKITSPSTAIPRGRGGHDTYLIWGEVPSDLKHEVQRFMDNLPPCWQSPKHDEKKPIGDILNSMRNAFNDYRYMPESVDDPPTSWSPAKLIKVAGAVYVSCLKHYVDRMCDAAPMHIDRLCWSLWCHTSKHQMRPGQRIVNRQGAHPGGSLLDQYTLDG